MRYHREQRAFSRAQAAYEDRMPDDDEECEDEPYLDYEKGMVLRHLEIPDPEGRFCCGKDSTQTNLSDHPWVVVEALLEDKDIYECGVDSRGRPRYFRAGFCCGKDFCDDGFGKASNHP